MIGGSGNASRRLKSEDRVRYDRILSDRHRIYWGDNCPSTDLDFLMCEFNKGVPVAIVDYKWYGADLNRTNSATYSALSELYGADGAQLPFFVARYWEDTWAVKLLPVNAAARSAVQRILSEPPPGVREIPLTEQQYVGFLYRLRRDALDAGDRRYLERLNQVPPDGGTLAAA